jgi:hypothetical protein
MPWCIGCMADVLLAGRNSTSTFLDLLVYLACSAHWFKDSSIFQFLADILLS